MLLCAFMLCGCALLAALPGPASAAVIDPTAPVDPQQARARLAADMPSARVLESGSRVRRVWGARLSHGTTPADSAESFMQRWSMVWGVPFSQLSPVGPFEDGQHLLPLMSDANGAADFTAVYWSQQVAGIPVYRSHAWVLVGNEPGHPAVLAGGTLRALGDFERRLESRQLAPTSLPALVHRSPALDRFRERPQIETPRYVVWAGVDDDLPEPRLGVEFKATAFDMHDPERAQSLLFVIDADTGEVLHVENLILHADATVQVQASVTPGGSAGACTAPETRGLPYLKVAVGAETQYTDSDGRLTLDVAVDAPVTVAPALDGLYFQVQDWTIPLQQVAPQSVQAGDSALFAFQSDLDEFKRSQVDTYTAANEVRDLVLRLSPSYPGIATQRSMRIQNNYSGKCNASYGGGVMNFYRSGGGCNNSGFRSVVCHEYGHHIVDRGGSGQGAFGEGFGDVLSVLSLDDPTIGLGFQTCSTGIRTAQNACVGTRTGSSCGGEIHAWGQVLAGCVWDLRNAYAAAHPADFLDRLGRLAVNEVPLHAGQSDIWTDITVDYIVLDDAPSNGGDNDLSNGSPNIDRIDAAFALHGLGAPLLEITPGAHPSLVNPAGGTTMEVRIDTGRSSIVNGSEALRVRPQGQVEFQRITLQAIGGGNYRAVFPPAPQGCTLEYYFEVASHSGSVVTWPTDGASGPITVLCSDFASLTVVGWGAGTTSIMSGSSSSISTSAPDKTQSVPRLLDGVRQLDGGGFYSVAVFMDGTVSVWGSSYGGVLSVPATATDVVQVSAGEAHVLALRQSGTVIGWGNNPFGQRTIPSGLQGVRQVDAGRDHSMALLSSGEVRCWGAGRTNSGVYPNYGQSLVPTGLASARQVGAGSAHSAACALDGTVTCWGGNNKGQTSVPATLNSATQVVCGDEFTAALVADGSAVLWGYAVHPTGIYRPPEASGALESIAAGKWHMVGLCADGHAVAWGMNWNGQATVPSQLGRAKAVAAGGQHSLALQGCRADLDGSGFVDFGDLVLILLEQGSEGGGPADLDRNGVVDLGDVAFQLLEHGPCI